jgi:hypothetical protein
MNALDLILSDAGMCMERKNCGDLVTTQFCLLTMRHQTLAAQNTQKLDDSRLANIARQKENAKTIKPACECHMRRIWYGRSGWFVTVGQSSYLWKHPLWMFRSSTTRDHQEKLFNFVNSKITQRF